MRQLTVTDTSFPYPLLFRMELRLPNAANNIPRGEIRNRFSTSVQEIFDLDLKSAPSIQLVYYHRVSDFE
ncbi:hypothetical protein TNCT_722251 [Trichonephila clavata]|uniref:Uncharacterized protein n=1 Tax=Trichonephila clavata TaxID=2740835 RepID=A0A8X6HW88_TRICU|nr:hypothetical protein TNCT_722251 [Trichonephila clavata]